MKCRYNPRKHEIKDEGSTDLSGKNDEVINNIAREFKFRKFVGRVLKIKRKVTN